VGGGLQVQPSEFAKVGLIASMAVLLGERRDGEEAPRGSDVVLVLLMAALPLALVLLQPDVGTAMVLAFVILGVLAVSGARARWLAGLLVAGALAAALAVHAGALKDYQVERFTSFTNPAADASGAGYATRQARIAIGSGGVTGKGLFQGGQTGGAFIPEQETDFIFTVAGEELGLLGGGLIIALLGLVLWRGLTIAARAPDLFGRLLATGVVAWLAFQSFVNIGMTLGITPVTGLPLPFVSYGGSAMFANLIGVGLLLNVHRRTTEP
ncbi:MAG: FtsW/RodA/SpoVE family cell cycle protein, partial [Mycobacteriales bacterium]